MVKGVNRRIILVKSPEPRLFEQAIFIVREDAAQSAGVTTEKLLAEARGVASRYIRRNTGLGRAAEKLKPLLWMALGAGLTGLFWYGSLLPVG